MTMNNLNTNNVNMADLSDPNGLEINSNQHLNAATNLNQQTSNQARQESAINQSKDAQTMINVLKDMGIEEFEPRVVNQLLEFSYRYIISLLEDARSFSSHAGKKTIDSEDIKMSIKSKVDFSFTTTPPRELLIEISKSKNKNPLPTIKYHSGIRLPPDRFCLHSQNFALKAPDENLLELERQQKLAASQANQAAASSKANADNTQSYMASSSNVQPTNLLANAPAKRRRDDEDDYDV